MKNASIEEKLRLLSGKDFWTTYGSTDLGIRELVFSDGPSGLRFQQGSNDHLGLNDSSKATCFPSPTALASTWDPTLISEVASCIAAEAAEKGVDVVLGPGVNIKRSPLCGRNFEYYSEDPYLTKEIGSAFIRGLQENGTGACLKHFAANNQEAYRMSINVVIDERALYEIYLKVFKDIIVQAEPWTVMSAYNKLLGDFCSENRWLLTQVLRESWNYKGMVISDWYAVNDIVKSVNNGLDLEMPSVGDLSFHLLKKALQNGSLSRKAVDRAISNIKRLNERCDEGRKSQARQADYDKHHEMARRAATESFVLLKNSKKSLPLKRGDRLLLVGDLMNYPLIQGNGSSRVNPIKTDSIPDELEKAGFTYTFEPGCPANGKAVCEELVNCAIHAAEKADKILVFAGLFNYTEAESYDRESLKLPECQDYLIDRLSRLGKELVIILQTGSAVEMPWIEKVDAVLQMHLAGQGAGKALADILSGKSNPSGKLTETYPLSLKDIPSYLLGGTAAEVEYRESIFTGYRYYDKKDIKVLFPFGYGLSYTEYAYYNLRVERLGEDITVTFMVENTGGFEGKEIVQVYVCLNEIAAIQPVRRLAAFSKINLKPGEKAEVCFKLSVNDFMYYDPVQKAFVFATGSNAVEVGRSSRQIELREKVEITESNRKYHRISRNTTIGEVRQIPALKEAVDKQVGALTRQLGLDNMEAVNARELDRSMFYMPLRNVVQISCGEFPYSALDAFIERLNEKLENLGALL